MSPFGPFRRMGPTDRFILRMAVLCAVLLIACGGLTLGYLGERHANQASQAVAGSCRFYRDLAGVPIAQTSSKALLTIIADARQAYETARCEQKLGDLPTPDPRVVPYIQSGFH